MDESEEDPKDFDPAETFGYAIAATISANKNGESLSLFCSWWLDVKSEKFRLGRVKIKAKEQKGLDYKFLAQVRRFAIATLLGELADPEKSASWDLFGTEKLYVLKETCSCSL